MGSDEKSLIKKEKEIEKLKQKIKEEEDKHKREQSRLKEEVKELDNRVKELLKEKQTAVVTEEQATHERDLIAKQLDGILEENKRLHEELAQVGVLKAEITGLKLRLENQITGTKELEQILLTKDEIIEQLRTSETKLREEIRTKNDEIAKRETMISVMKSGKLNIEQSLQHVEDKVSTLNTEITTLKTTLINKDGKISQLNDQVESLEKEKATFDQMLRKNDDELANLKIKYSESEIKIQRLEKGMADAEAGIISSALPNLVKGDSQAADKIAEISRRVKANAVLAIPEFEAVPAMLDLENLRSSTRLRIMTYVDFNNPKHKAIFTEISRPNILIRHNEGRNLWGINRDNEEVLIAPRDFTGVPTGLIVKDSFQIEILGNLLLEIWGKCRRNVDQYSFT